MSVEPTHEYIFLFTKSPRYWFDADAVREPNEPSTIRIHGNLSERTARHKYVDNKIGNHHKGGRLNVNGGERSVSGRNVRSVWTTDEPQLHVAPLHTDRKEHMERGLCLDDGDVRLYLGDALETVRGMPDESVDCVVTSPPYWGLRDYGSEGQMGLEATPDLFVAGMVELFREIRRVLAPHGTCWVNLGDSYAAARAGHSHTPHNGTVPESRRGEDAYGEYSTAKSTGVRGGSRDALHIGLKHKDLVGIPWRVAFALQADGWWLRSDIIWSKPNPMPESVTDRPTKAHEYVFLLTKQPRYWFDTEAVREEYGNNTHGGYRRDGGNKIHHYRNQGNPAAALGYRPGERPHSGRNVRSVWNIATQPYPEAHFATFPEELARRCILAGCPVRVCRVCGKPSERIVETEYRQHPRNPNPIGRRDGSEAGEGYRPSENKLRDVATVGWSDCGHNDWRPGVVLDPFIGSGTVAKVARDHQRHAIGIDLNETYLELAARRLQQLSLLT